MTATAFVGREDVLGRLDRAPAAAAAGAGCVALIHGEAGIGKTRLCQQLQDAHRRRGGQVLLGRGSPEESAIAYGAIADWAGFRFRHPLLQESAYEDVPPPRRTALHQEVARALSRGCADGGSAQAAERIAFHLDRAGQPEAALAVLEEGAGLAQQAGEIGRGAALCLAALSLARRHDQLAPRRPWLEQQAIRALFTARRWSELDPLIRDAWSRSGALRPAERISLANVFGEHLLWSGAVAEAWSLIQAELANVEPDHAGADAARLLVRGGGVAWFRGDHEQARQHVERAWRPPAAPVTPPRSGTRGTTSPTSATRSTGTCGRPRTRSARAPRPRGSAAARSGRR